METKLKVENTITINATPEKVWDALVNSEKTKQYMYGCDAISDWKVGSPLLWEGEHEGNRMVFVSGYIKEIKPYTELTFTVIDPNVDMEDIPANYLNVKYTLASKENKTELTVVQDGFEDAADGEKRYQDVYNNGEGWSPILKQIKEIVEKTANP